MKKLKENFLIKKKVEKIVRYNYNKEENRITWKREREREKNTAEYYYASRPVLFLNVVEENLNKKKILFIKKYNNARERKKSIKYNLNNYFINCFSEQHNWIK